MADKIQFLRRIDGAAGTPGDEGFLPGEVFLNFPDEAGVGTEVIFSAFDGTWWRTVSVSVAFATAPEVLAGVVSTKSISPAGLQSRLRAEPSVVQADDVGCIPTLDADGKIPSGFIDAEMELADFASLYASLVADEGYGAPAAAATFTGALAFLDEEYRREWLSTWFDDILLDNHVLARSGGVIAGIPMTTMGAMTFPVFAAGTPNVYPDARSLALLDFPKAVTIASGVAQVAWNSASVSSLYRTVALSALATAADLRFTALTEAEDYLKGKEFKVEVTNTDGGAKTFTIADAVEAGDAVVSLATGFSLPSIGTTAGDRLLVRGSIAADGAILIRAAEAYVATEEELLTPSYVGSSSHYEWVGTTLANYHLALPPGAQAGDLAVITVPQAAASLTALGYGTSHELITRLNSTVGSHYGVSCYTYTLTGTDITNGYLNIPSLTNATAIGVDVFRNVNNVVHAASFTRSTGLNANSITLESETSTEDASIALAIVARGGGMRTATYPAGWTERIHERDESVAGQGRIALHTMTRTLGAAGAVSPADSFAITGAADLCLTTFTLLLEKA